MSTEFRSVDAAKAYVAFGALGPDAIKIVWEDIETIVVGGIFEEKLLSSPETCAETKQAIVDRHQQQKSFRGRKPNGSTIAVTIGPFRNGFECWLIDEESGMCLRL